VRIVEALRQAGFQAYLVGGCVRDLLLSRAGQPISVRDWDVATDARPEEVLRLFPEARLVGAQFGVVLVHDQEAEVEVATFRSDHSYLDGRHPIEVRFETDPQRDVQRRDFTINALMLDPRTGEVLDFVGGQQDLVQGLVRSVGEPEKRFEEDHLRMLRAVRFAASLRRPDGRWFEMEPRTFEAIRKLKGLIRRVSPERIRDELTRILVEANARRGFELLDATGLLEEILPEVAAMKGVPQPPEFHPEGDVWTHTLLMLERLDHPSPTLAWGVLLHDVGKPPTFRIADRIRFDDHCEVGARMATDILRRLRFSNAEIRQVEALVKNHLRFKDVQRMKESTLKRFVRLEKFEEHLELHRLDCLASHGNLENYYFVKAKLEEWKLEDIRPPRLITGEDLIRAGYRPGPAFRQMLEFVETAQLESRVRTRDEALALVQAHFSPPDGRPKSAGT